MACCRTRNDMAMYSLTHAITILTCRLDRLVSVCSGALPTCRVYNLVRRCMYPCANTLHTAHILSYTYTTYGMVLNPCTHHVLNQCPQKNKHPHQIYKETRKSEMESKTPAPPNEDKSSAVFHVPWVSYPSIILSRSRKSSPSPVPPLIYTTITPSPMSSRLVDLDTIPRVIRARPLMFQRHDGAVDAFNVRPRFGPCFRDGVHGGFDAGGAAGFGIGGGCGCRLPTVSCEQGRERDGIGGERTNQCRCLCVVVL
jgi:hypothetical protein